MVVQTIRNLDIYVPNFDYHLNLLLEKSTPEQKELMPQTLAFKIFKNGNASVDKLNFTEKLFLLSVCFKQNIAIATFDENAEIGSELFDSAIKAQKGLIKNGELLENMKLPTLFVQSDKQLMQAFMYMNHVQCTDIFNLVRAANPKNISKKEEKKKEYNRALTGVVNLLRDFERNKKKVIMQFGISVPKLYALLNFFDGEKSGKDFYGLHFRHSYTSNRGDLGAALSELYQEGYLSRRGAQKTYKYNITSKGIELLTRIMNKLVYNV